MKGGKKKMTDNIVTEEKIVKKVKTEKKPVEVIQEAVL